MQGTALVMGWIFAIAEVPDAIAALITSLTTSHVRILLGMLAPFLGIGTFLDPLPAILIFTRIFQPLAESLRMSPVHFAVVMVLEKAHENDALQNRAAGLAQRWPLLALVMALGADAQVAEQPKKVPTLKEAIIARATESVARSTSAAVRADSATTDPTERSISPAESTNAIPTAITVMGAVWRMMFMKFPTVRNPVSRRVIAKKRRIIRNPM